MVSAIRATNVPKSVPQHRDRGRDAFSSCLGEHSATNSLSYSGRNCTLWNRGSGLAAVRWRPFHGSVHGDLQSPGLRLSLRPIHRRRSGKEQHRSRRAIKRHVRCHVQAVGWLRTLVCEIDPQATSVDQIGRPHSRIRRTLLSQGRQQLMTTGFTVCRWTPSLAPNLGNVSAWTSAGSWKIE